MPNFVEIFVRAAEVTIAVVVPVSLVVAVDSVNVSHGG